MGTSLNKEILTNSSQLKIKFLSYETINPSSSSFSFLFSSFISYSFLIFIQKFQYKIKKRFHEIKELYKYLQRNYFTLVSFIKLPKNYYKIKTKSLKLLQRGKGIETMIFQFALIPEIFNDSYFRHFLEIGTVIISLFLLIR